jgi:transcriptional antiterminator RfaH
MRRWYVAQTHSRAEAKAIGHLRRQGFEVYLPQYRKTRRHARRLERVRVPLFPGYLFVAIDVARAQWRAIRSTVGVRSLICNGDAPVAVPDGIVDGIRAREDAERLVEVPAPVPFARGEAVRITDGPMRDQVGLFDCVTDEDRVVVLLTLLGRQVRWPVSRAAVAAFA